MIPGWVGLALCLVALIGFALTLVSFGDSFRVGIDEHTTDKLVTSGMFAISRNPIYVCFLMFFTGLFLIHRNIVIAVSVVLFALAIHRQVLREEMFLASHYGEEYENYCKKVRRYL
jgi:protein-S-isoprenylcysteine O-methyltransferase Ste14